MDSLTTVRRLKEKGVEVYFEKENIYTLDSKGELLITIMSSLAQEESCSISENVTWGKRKRCADGKVSLAYSSFLGYRKGEDGQMEIVPEEAETVRLIYRLFMPGQTPYAIAKYLTDKNIPTPTGKENWRHRTVENILSDKISTTFSVASLRGLAKRRSCRWIPTRSCSTGLWIAQRSIRTAGWCSPSATGWKSARRYKAGSGQGIEVAPDASGRCFCVFCLYMLHIYLIIIL